MAVRVMRVTMPKSLEPPFRARKSEGFEVGEAVTMLPEASATWYSRMLEQAKPNRPAKKEMPPVSIVSQPLTASRPAGRSYP